ncbi:MAG TPA: hypothetical protein VGS09_08900 [Actinomycetota bacterium]|nr:hypothetical protein [Actinomycetota bacterium]
MSTERRCPNCGGLVGADAEWCGQCFARLDRTGRAPGVPEGAKRPAPPGEPPEEVQPAEAGSPLQAAVEAEAGGGGGGAVRRTAQGLVWTCPRCDLANPIELRICTRCGARFESLFTQPEQGPRIDPGRAARLSLLFPGAGHIAAGRTADGVARAVVFAWVALTVVAILVMRGGFRPGPLLPVLLLYLAAAAVVYGVTAVDARRAVDGEPPLLTSRMLLYGVGVLILLTVGVMFLLGVRAR